MALYETTIRQTFGGQDCLAVLHHYASDALGESPSAFELLSLLGGVPVGTPLLWPEDTFMFELQQMQHEGAETNEIQVSNLYDAFDFYLAGYSPAIAGNQTGTAESPFVAFALRSTRVRTDIRRGSKRFVGVNESAAGELGVLESTYQTYLTAVADALSAPLVGSSATYQTAVLHYEMYTAPPAKPAYRPYSTEVAQVANSAVGVVWNIVNHVTTQNSRKR